MASSANRSRMQVCIDKGRSLCKLKIAKDQVLILEALLLLYVVGLIVYLKCLLAGNGLSNMTETMTACCC